MAQIVLGAAGAAAGFLVGGPAGAIAGFGVGYGIGMAIKGQPAQEGPRLEDLKYTSSQYGQPIPWLRGAPRVSGQIVWASDKRELASTSSAGGKGGGPDVTSYTYEIDVLVMLCDHPAAAVTRIWSNGKLIWTVLTGATDESLAASGQGQGGDLSPTGNWRRLTFYAGSATQLPDPTYEAAVGVGNATAYRGRATLMIEGLQLGGSGQLPNLTFEVAQVASAGVAAASTGPTQAVGSYISCGTAAASSSTTFRIHAGQWNTSYATLAVKVYDIDIVAGTSTEVGAYSVLGAWQCAQGETDTPILMIAFGTSVAGYSGLSGTLTSWTIPEDMGSTQFRFALRGSNIIFGSQSQGSRRLYRYASSGSITPAATSPILSTYVNQITIIGSTVYAVATSGGSVYVLDLTTLSLQSTLATPASGSRDWVFSLNGQLCLIASISGSVVPFYLYSGGTWSLIGSITSSAYKDGDNVQSIGVVGNLLVLGSVATPIDSVYRTYKAGLTVTTEGEGVQTIVEAICARAGMPAGSYDATALSGITRTVRSLALTSGASRGALEQLGTAFFFQASLRDKIYFRPRGGSVAATIPWGDLAARPEEPDDQSLPLTIGNELELPPQVAVSYINAADDGETGTEYSDRMTSGQAAVQTINLGIGLVPADAKIVADATIAEATAAILTGAISLPISYARLDPSDVVQVVDRDGSVYRLRLQRRRDERGVISFEVVGDDASAIASDGLTDDTQTSDNGVTAPGETVFIPLDVALLRDEDNSHGYYVAAKGAKDPWPGGQVQSSIDGTAYTKVAEITERAVFGVCTTTLGGFSGIGWDEINSVTINVGAGELSSSTRAAMYVDGTINAMAIGAEVIRFRTATLVSAGVYTLSGLIRGAKGTEWAIGSHAASERCALLRAQGLRRVSQQSSESGQLRYLRGGSLGVALSSSVTNFTNTNVAIRPLSPVDLRAARQANGDVLVTWKRRTRLSTSLTGAAGITAPLDETVEQYVARVYADAAYSDLVHEVTTTTPSGVYPLATLLADSARYLDAIFYVEVRQVSALGVEGYPARQALDPGTYDVSLDPPPPLPTSLTKRVFFRYTPASNTSAFAWETTEYGGGGDESTFLGVRANFGPSGSWLAQLDGRVLFNQPATTYVSDGASGRTSVAVSNLRAAAYDAAASNFMALQASGAAMNEVRISTAGSVSSTTALTLNGIATGWPATISALIKWGSEWLAFSSASGLQPLLLRSNGSTAWTSSAGWDVGGLPFLSGTVRAVGLMSSPSAAVLVGVVYTDNTVPTGVPAPTYLYVFKATSGITFSLVASILLNTAGGLVANSGPASGIVTPSGTGNEFIRVGSKLAFYFSCEGTGGQGPGTYVAMSGTSHTAAWTVSKCTVDGSGTIAPSQFVGTENGAHVVARRAVDFGFATASASLLVSTDGVAFTTVGDAATWATGYADQPGDYVPIVGSFTGDLRHPLFSDGNTVVFERKLRN